MKDLFSKVFRGGLVVAEAVVEEKLRESGLNSQEVVYTACDSSTDSHFLRGHNRNGDFYITITSNTSHSMYSTLTLSSKKDTEELIERLIEMKEALT